MARKPPTTLARLALEGLLGRAIDLPVGASLFLPDRADGGGGLLITHYSRYAFSFQRTGYNGPLRWINNAGQIREEIVAYMETGELKKPDGIKEW
jgi:hypothetical protein